MPQTTERHRAEFSVLDELSLSVRAWWIQEVRTAERQRQGYSYYKVGAWWDGGVVNGQERSNIWQLAAKVFLRETLPFFEYISFVVNRGKHPRPNHLLSRQLISEFRRSITPYSVVTTTVDLRSLLQSQLAATQTQVRALCQANADGKFEEVFTAAALRDMVIADTTTGLTPLFRYCLATREGANRLAERYRRDAIVQYLGHPEAYAKAWGEWIPGELALQANTVYGLEKD